MQQSYRFIVTGLVQGVGFRESARRKAITLGLVGWVRNCEDRRVEGVVAGESERDLETFRDWLSVGPPAARVTGVEWRRSDESCDGSLFHIQR